MKRKKVILLFTLALLCLNIYAQGERVAPFQIEVAYIKTVHITFPAKVKYVDLGSNFLIAGKADETENVIRVKAAYKGFESETNFSVICEDGSFYTFIATYNDDPEVLFHEMNPIVSSLTDKMPNNNKEIILKDIDGESPMILQMILNSIYKDNIRDIASIGERKNRIEATVRGIYVKGNILYFHIGINNTSDVTYDVDYIRFTVKDRKKFKKQASQEEELFPVREFKNNSLARATGRSTYRCVYAFNKFTLLPDKVLQIEVAEKRGGRTILFDVMPSDILGAKPVKSIRL